MTIRAANIRPGDRIAYKRAEGNYKTRTVYAVGDNYVTVMISGDEIKVPEHRITSHVASK